MLSHSGILVAMLFHIAMSMLNKLQVTKNNKTAFIVN